MKNKTNFQEISISTTDPGSYYAPGNKRGEKKKDFVYFYTHTHTSNKFIRKIKNTKYTGFMLDVYHM